MKAKGKLVIFDQGGTAASRYLGILFVAFPRRHYVEFRKPTPDEVQWSAEAHLRKEKADFIRGRGIIVHECTLEE